MKSGHNPDEHKSWGWFIGLVAGFLLIVFGNVSSTYNTPPGTSPTMETRPPLSVSIASVITPGHTCLLTSSPATITVRASDIGGQVTRVEFYDGSTLLGNDTEAPFTFTWQSPAKGSHTLTAKAFDNYNYDRTSDAMTVTVFTNCSNAPILTIHIMSPADNALLHPPVAIKVRAAETYTPGSSAITKVEFYDDKTLVGHTSATPYSFTWTNPSVGLHRLMARVYDQKGHTASSSRVSFTIQSDTSPIPTPTAKPTTQPTPNARPTPTPVKENAGCQVNYQIVSQWPGGFSVNLVITNTGSTAIEDWALAFTFPGDQRITNLWNGNLAQTGKRVTITNASWNSGITPHGSVNLGFNGAWTENNAIPGSFTLNGLTCTSG